MALVETLRGMRSGDVLDLGCGTGALTNEIAGFARQAIGIDSSPAMIKKAAETYPDLTFHLMDARSMTWESRFDAVFSNAVFHFIKDQDALLDRVFRALRSGGALVCEFGAAGNIAGLLDAVGAACVKRGKPYAMRFYYPTEDEYGGLLKRHGFSIEYIAAYDLDTTLKEGAAGLRNWVNQIFGVEMGWFGESERESALAEIEAALRPAQWDGGSWHLKNRRLKVIARK
jgi:SAM-dependent methyltransferase